MPADAVRKPQLIRQRLQGLQLVTAAHMVEPPVKAGRKQRQCPQQDIETLFRHRAPDGQDGNRVVYIGTVPCRRHPFRRREPAEVETVIAQMHLAGIIGK